MKKIISLIALVFSFSFSKTVEKLENGTYKVELDTKYKEIGMNDYEFTL